MADQAAASAPRVLRLAHQLTGDAEVAVAIAVEALSRSSTHRIGAAGATSLDVDERVLRDVVRLALREAVPRRTTRSRLDDLPRRARVAVVLALGLGWDAASIAEVTGAAERRVRSVVLAAIASDGEASWRRLLAESRWVLQPPADLVDRCRQATVARRTRSRLRLLGAAAAVVALAGGSVAVGRAVTAPVPVPSAAHVPGLLDWPVRGDLVRDRAFISAATAVWTGSALAPSGAVHLLWAGRVGVGRLAVLQAADDRRGPLAAVVADHDESYRHPRLHLYTVSPLARSGVPMLAVPYDGNLDIPGLAPGPGSQVVQLLTAPDVERVDQRRMLAEGVPPVRRPVFTGEPLAFGMSQPWLDLTGQRPATAVRAYRHGRVVFVGLLGQGLQPAPVEPRLVPPPANWAGLSASVDSLTNADDDLWWAQVCQEPDPRVATTWSSTSPLAPGLRLEHVTCRARDVGGAFLSGTGDDVRWLPAGGIAVNGSSTAYVLSLDRSAGQATFVVVGSTAVRSITIGSHRFGRIAVIRAPNLSRVIVSDKAG